MSKDSSSPAPVLSFPANLIAPPKTQVSHYEDAVTQRVQALDAYAARLAEGFGLPFTPGIELNEMMGKAAAAAGTNPLAIVAALMSKSMLVTLERREGRWGLYYTSNPAMLGANALDQRTTVPLKDAPLNVRELFLRRSEEFFRAYLATCENRLGTMKGAVDAGDRTLDLLRNLQLR